MLAQIPEGNQGIRETLKLMRDWVREFKSNPTIRDKAVNLVFYIPRHNLFAKAKAVWNFVRTNIRYVHDPNGVELVHWPTQVLSQAIGDCDDHATLVASLLEAIGIPTRLVAVGFEPGRFSHVYAEALLGRDWFALDTTEPDQPFGWRPPGIVSVYIVRN